MKTLYHYTSIERWERIEADGRINTTESNLSATTEHAGPNVVWLTNDPNCEHGHGLLNTRDGTDKTRVQITVELPNRDVHKWRNGPSDAESNLNGCGGSSKPQAAWRAGGVDVLGPVDLTPVGFGTVSVIAGNSGAVGLGLGLSGPCGWPAR